MTVTIDGTAGVTTPALTVAGTGTSVLLPPAVAGTYTQTLPAGNGELVLTQIVMNFPTTLGAAGDTLVTDGAGNLSWVAGGGGGSGTVTSVNVSGGTTGLTFSGGAITTSGTITMAGTLSAANGGTGLTALGAGVSAALSNAANGANGLAVLDGTASIPVSKGGTGATTVSGAQANLFPAQAGHSGEYLTTNGTGTLSWVAAAGAGTVTSVDGSGGTTGLTLTGGPITGAGTLTLGGTLAITNGGTGAATRQAAINALAGSVTSGRYLRGDGTNIALSAIQVADVPTLNQNTTGTAANVSGTVAIANGGTGQTSASAAFDALAPSQASANGKFLTSNGTTASWASIIAGDGNTLTANYGGSAPGAGVGNNGDYALDSSTGNVYGPKAAGAWPSTAAFTLQKFVPPTTAPAGSGTGPTPTWGKFGQGQIWNCNTSALTTSLGNLAFEGSRDNGVTWTAFFAGTTTTTYGIDLNFSINPQDNVVGILGVALNYGVAFAGVGYAIIAPYVAGDLFRFRDTNGTNVTWEAAIFSQVGA
jgi:hypothetical protein